MEGSRYVRFNDVESAVKRNVTPNSSQGNGTFDFLDLEIERNCLPVCQDFGKRPSIPLFRYQDIPHFLQGNPYVTGGYRSMLPFSLCCKSLFVWSNETINIWSHLTGCFIFLFLIFYDNLFALPNSRATFSDHLIVTLGLFCFQFCLLCSAGYHLFNCHSERASRRWLALDLAGISVGLIGCYLPGVHYAFYCLSIWRDIYLIVISILFLVVLLVQTNPQYLSQAWDYRRIVLYMGLVGYGIVPTIHWVYLTGGMATQLVQIFLPKVTVMYLLAVLAFFFYISKMPERYFPGRFDYVGSSHQLWHIIILMAFLWWHQAGKEILDYRISNPCHP